MLRKRLLASCLAVFPALAQHTESAGQSAPATAVDVKVKAADGTFKVERRSEPAKKDAYGNAAGNRHDLAVDGAFDGQTIVVLRSTWSLRSSTKTASAPSSTAASRASTWSGPPQALANAERFGDAAVAKKK